MAVTLIASWMLSVFAVASTLGGTTAVTGPLYAIPAVLVLTLGLLARKLVPHPHRAPFEHVGVG